MKIDFTRLTNTAYLPTRGSAAAAGYDLYADIDSPITIAAHCTKKIGTGLAAAIPENYFGAIFARSGLATKRDLLPSNAVGVVDADYRGQIIVALHNNGCAPQTVQPHERIAQLVILPFLSFEINEVEYLDETERGSGGFGSTGTN